MVQDKRSQALSDMEIYDDKCSQLTCARTSLAAHHNQVHANQSVFDCANSSTVNSIKTKP